MKIFFNLMKVLENKLYKMNEECEIYRPLMTFRMTTREGKSLFIKDLPVHDKHVSLKIHESKSSQLTFTI